MFGWLKKYKPVNVNDLSNRHFVAGLVAHEAEQHERHSGTVASRHLPGIAKRQFDISDALDRMLEANEKSEKAG